MPIIFQLICVFVAFAIGAFVASVALLLRGQRRRHRALAAVFGLLLSLASATWALAWFASIHGTESADTSAFQQAAGFVTPSGVSEIRSFARSAPDAFEQCLTFQARPEAIRAIVSRGAFAPDRSVGVGTCGKTLRWWTPSSDLMAWVRRPGPESKATFACPEQGGTCFLHVVSVD